MHIFITGTRGIPAQYGGFETFAQELSRRLAERGHAVTVCNPSSHPYRGASWEGVEILRRPWPAFPGGVLWYDRLCMREAYRRRPAVILNCGYGNAAFIRKAHPVPVVTLTDGLEWQRAGWSAPARRWLHKMERKAAERSRLLVSDHPEIARHYRERYGKDTPVIPYGAEIPAALTLPDGRTPGDLLREHLQQQQVPFSENLVGSLTAGNYFLTVGRFVPENNLSMILEGYVRSGIPFPLVLVGNAGNRFGRQLQKKYGPEQNILFTGPVYDKHLLDLLRHHARGYLHGHSAGGTNPALLEAMAAGSLIAAHDNPFNRYVLGEGSRYFGTAEALSRLLAKWEDYRKARREITQEYLRRIREEYDWDRITDAWEEVFFRDLRSH